MPNLDIYLFFDGQCGDAMRFYQRTLGGQLDVKTYADSPDPQQCGGDAKDLVMHARLLLDGRSLMASDQPPGLPPNPMGGFAVSLQYPTPAEARRVFDQLAQGGSVQMPIGKTFWAEAFGMLTDRYGTRWMVGGNVQTA